VAHREPRPDTAATAVVVFAVTDVAYIIVPSVLFARRDPRLHSLSHRGKCGSGKARHRVLAADDMGASSDT
jgi:hypothetical protein